MKVVIPALVVFLASTGAASAQYYPQFAQRYYDRSAPRYYQPPRQYTPPRYAPRPNYAPRGGYDWSWGGGNRAYLGGRGGGWGGEW